VNVPTSKSRWLAAASLLLLSGACVSHQHTVGLGATGTGEAQQRQYFVLFGLVQVNEVDTQRMAADLSSYTIDTRFSLIDLLLAPFLAPLTATSRTVAVRT
jgi:hypothetical protein